MNWKAPGLVLNLYPELKSIWNYDHFLTYVDRWVNHGGWAQPDPCAPVAAADMTAGVWPTTSGNYGVTYGPDGNNDCIRDTDASD